MIHPDSQAAYDELIGTMTDKQRVVYEALRALGRATMHEVASYLGLGAGVNVISGRFGELRDQKKIEECGTDRSSGRPRAIWRIKEEVFVSKSNPQTLRMFSTKVYD